MNRRQFLFSAGGAALGCSATCGAAHASTAEKPSINGSNGYGVLVDTPECIGCRKCEFACAESHALTGKPLEVYEDRSVFDHPRRMDADAFTVVNRYPNPQHPEKPTYVKIQCMHCKEPACVSACLVGALRRQEKGDVAYDPWKCMGCRYCMVACPFQVPAYEYDDAFTPRVRKCDLCHDRIAKEGQRPACVEMCPTNCMTFAPLDQLLALAREKIAANPERYQPTIYGEKEVGGTGWLYLTAQPATDLGMLELGEESVTHLPEKVQHNVFKGGLPPLILLGALGLAMRTFMHNDPSEGVTPTDHSADTKSTDPTSPEEK